MMNSSDIAGFLDKMPNREVYNVIIDGQTPPETIYKPYSQLDLGATILDKLQAAQTYKLGLGTSLLKEDKTFIEKYGLNNFETELLKNSKEYNRFLGF